MKKRFYQPKPKLNKNKYKLLIPVLILVTIFAVIGLIYPRFLKTKSTALDMSGHFNLSDTAAVANGLLASDDVKDVFIYDTSKDTNPGWNTMAFPVKANLVATSTSVDIIDVSNNTLWMRISSGSGKAVADSISSVFAQNGRIYVGTIHPSIGINTHTAGLYTFDFTQDKIFWTKSNGTATYLGAIASRDASDGWSALQNYPSLTKFQNYGAYADQINGITGNIIGGQEYLAVTSSNTYGGGFVNLIKPADFVVNTNYLRAIGDEGSFNTYDPGLSVDIKGIYLSSNGSVYAATTPAYSGYSAIEIFRDITTLINENTVFPIIFNKYGSLLPFRTNQISVLENGGSICAGGSIIFAAQRNGASMMCDYSIDLYSDHINHTAKTWTNDATSGNYTTGSDYQILPENQATAIASNGTDIWIGQLNNGISEIEISNPTVIHYKYTIGSDIGVSSNKISALSYDQTLLIGSTDNGATSLGHYTPGSDFSTKAVEFHALNDTADTFVYDTAKDIDLYTRLLLHMEGANNGNIFTDSSPNNLPIYRYPSSNTKTVTTSPAPKIGDSIGYFPATLVDSPGTHGDYLKISDTSAFSMGTGAFTIDTWIYPTVIGPNDNMIWSIGNGSGTIIYLAIMPNGAIQYTEYGTGGVSHTSSPGVITVGQWYYIAFERDISGNLKLFINGISKTLDNSIVPSISLSGNTFYIGWWPDVGAVDYFQGYMDDFRVSKGIARYTSDFTPPAGITSWTSGTGKSWVATRGSFPAIANLVASPTSADIVNASNNTLWMRINIPSASVFAQNGRIYIGSTDNKLYVLDLVQDKVDYLGTNGFYQYSGTVADYLSGSSTASLISATPSLPNKSYGSLTIRSKGISNITGAVSGSRDLIVIDGYESVSDDDKSSGMVPPVYEQKIYHTAVIDMDDLSYNQYYTTSGNDNTDTNPGVGDGIYGTIDELRSAITSDGNLYLAALHYASSGFLIIDPDNRIYFTNVLSDPPGQNLLDSKIRFNADWLIGSGVNHVNDFQVLAGTNNNPSCSGQSNSLFVGLDKGATLIKDCLGNVSSSVADHWSQTETASIGTVHSVLAENKISAIASDGNYLWLGQNSAAPSGYLPDSYTKLLMHFDGPNNSTTFTDSSSSNHVFSPNFSHVNSAYYGLSGCTVSPTISTAQSKFGGSSALFGVNQCIATPDIPPDPSDFEETSGSTIDFWIYPTAIADQAHNTVFGKRLGADNEYFSIHSDGAMVYYERGSGYQVVNATSAGIVQLGSIAGWQHIAIVKGSGATPTLKMYYNGSEVYSGTSIQHISGTDFLFGFNWNFPIGNFYRGYLDEFRVSKGIERWTSDFTPPAAEYGSGIAEIEIANPNTVNYYNTISIPALSSNTISSLSTGVIDGKPAILAGNNLGSDFITQRLTLADQDGDGISDNQDLCPLPYQHNTCYLTRSQEIVSASSGGTVTTPDNQVTINIPTGALASDTTISAIGGRSNFALPGTGGQMIADYQLSPSPISFSSPVTVRMYYTDADRIAAGITVETNLKPYYFDGATWNIITPYFQDVTANYIEFTVTHFSEYGLGGEVTTSETPIYSPAPTETITNPIPPEQPIPITPTTPTSQVISYSLQEIELSPIPEFNPDWGADYPSGRVNWALDHRANIYRAYQEILKRNPSPAEVNWWLQYSGDINLIRYLFLTSDEYQIKNK